MSLFVVSGLSGSGKSSILKWLNENKKLLPKSIIVDQDSYFYARMKAREKMPTIVINGKTVMNYDSPQSIDNKALEQYIKQNLAQGNNVYLSAFMYRDNMYDLQPLVHFHMVIGKEISLYRRITSKRYFTDRQKDDDIKMMEAVIYPAYLKTLRMSSIDCYLDGMLPLDYNGKTIYNIISKLQLPANSDKSIESIIDQSTYQD